MSDAEPYRTKEEVEQYKRRSILLMKDIILKKNMQLKKNWIK